MKGGKKETREDTRSDKSKPSRTCMLTTDPCLTLIQSHITVLLSLYIAVSRYSDVDILQYANAHSDDV